MLHWVKHFVNHSLVITHLPDDITLPLLVVEVRSKHSRYWEKNVNFQQVFYDISVSPTITALILVLFNEMTWLMYGKKKCKNFDDARL